MRREHPIGHVRPSLLGDLRQNVRCTFPCKGELRTHSYGGRGPPVRRGTNCVRNWLFIAPPPGAAPRPQRRAVGERSAVPRPSPSGRPTCNTGSHGVYLVGKALTAASIAHIYSRTLNLLSSLGALLLSCRWPLRYLITSYKPSDIGIYNS
jgi:hypothetical protein